jgi:serine/threonine protein kinase
MNSKLIRTGCSSIILGSGHYGDFLPPKKNKLLKITKISDKHNEFKYLDIVRSIPNYRDYYSIPDETSYLLDNTYDFYNKVKILVKNDKMNIFDNVLYCYYIDYAGEKDVHTTINDLYEIGYSPIWSSYKKILDFTKHIIKGLSFLHERKICHLDIKSENIMVINNTFKIIDFGFSSSEPFDDYVFNIRGTSGYFPYQFNTQIFSPIFPKIETNDLTKLNNHFPMIYDRQLVYKIDSYCLGRLLYCLIYVYNDMKTYCCYNYETRTQNKLKNITNDLLNNDVFERISIEECLVKYFS